LHIWLTAPFFVLLGALALGSVTFPKLWEKYSSVFIVFSGVACLSAMSFFQGVSPAFRALGHMMKEDYGPFILVISILYVLVHSMDISINASATPFRNMLFLALGMGASCVLGTTGASLLLFYPLMAFNAHRTYKTHTVIFFIICIGNVGGCLSTLGDPPLFVGFLKGLPFFWPTQHLFLPWLIVAVPVLFLYFLIDRYHARREGVYASEPVTVTFHGIGALLLIGMVTTSMIVLEEWTLDPEKGWIRLGVLCLFFGIALMRKKPKEWKILQEVAIVFGGLFITMMPVLTLLQRGEIFTSLFKTLTTKGSAKAFFWTTGMLSAFLDNTPTYLVFRHLANHQLPLLIAVSVGAVFMGALTYIGNAPNFFIKAMAEKENIPMPSFFGYLGWTILILFPSFLLLTWWLP
jgi:Na+/H+ antiporter NhaD/arsenite permease-like protein